MAFKHRPPRFEGHGIQRQSSRLVGLSGGAACVFHAANVIKKLLVCTALSFYPFGFASLCLVCIWLIKLKRTALSQVCYLHVLQGGRLNANFSLDTLQ
jgi:Flp pilus assembly protein TadB